MDCEGESRTVPRNLFMIAAKTVIVVEDEVRRLE